MRKHGPTLPGTPEYYRERAADMLQRAEKAATDDARDSFLLLAQTWDNLARQSERPAW